LAPLSPGPKDHRTAATKPLGKAERMVKGMAQALGQKRNILNYGVGFGSQAQGVMDVIEKFLGFGWCKEEDWIGLYVVTWSFNAACGLGDGWVDGILGMALPIRFTSA